ncbi:hypothetical protein RINTHM_8750 [Richelia intracellularis HM01]|uniref:hypothetical protein n=1 Tax=Richelia intracellularis TaxID=1164990 RepID=UPI0002B5365A|nr:hypothetical protein [Richelia intracellularis]CCH65337.1 hypothetical protein RINTHM_8750 [Richelia intracellularis HM01]
MFPFWGYPFCSFDKNSIAAHQERKLHFLKMIRDTLEARIAAMNAAIETIERQTRQSENDT